MAANRSSSRQVKQEPDKENNVLHKRPPSGGNRRLKHSNSSSLEILEPEDSLKNVSTSESDFYKESRPSSNGKRSGNVGSVPPRPDSSLSRRTPTPTKQISLQAVKRKEDRDDPIVTDIDWKELQSHSRHKGRKEDVLAHQFKDMTIEDGGKNHADKSSIPFSYSSRHHNCSHHHNDTEKEEKRERLNGQSKIPKETKEGPQVMEKTPPTDAGLPEAAGGKVESSTDTDSDEDEEERKAPNQLLMEFVTCLMEKDYPNAQKLCKMILLYEPNNPEALKFQPLIDEKIDLDNEPEPESDSGESEGEDGEAEEGDDSEDDEEDSDSDSSDSDSDDDSEDDDDNDDGVPEVRRLDSGIASAAGSD